MTINGQDFSRSAVFFRYYDPSAWRLLKFTPRGGPLAGNTTVRLDADKLQPLGDVRCRFGDYPLTEEMNATIIRPSLVQCVSPPHWERKEGKQHVEIQLTLNGQDYLRIGTQSGYLQARQFTYYALDDSVKGGLSVLRLSPNGGPSAGGTLVRVAATGIADVGGLMCRMQGESPVGATLSDDAELLRCTTPRLASYAMLPQSRARST